MSQDEVTGRVDVVVVGGGLAGLAAAVTAADGGATVRVLDGRRLGGRAATTVVDPGVAFNAGPRALYRSGPGARVLADLGVEPAGAVPPTGGDVLLAGRLQPLPDSPLRLLRFRLLSPGSKWRVGLLLSRVQQLDPASFDGSSVREWFDRLGLRDDAQALVRAVIRLATYTDDVDRFSAGAAIRQLQLALGDGVLYLDGGWQQLVDALVDRAAAAGVSVDGGTEVRSVRPGTPETFGPAWVVETRAQRIEARSVVLACGGPDVVDRLVPGVLERSGLGPPVTAACLELAMRGTPRSRLLLGVDEPLYLSVHSPPAGLAPEGISVVHAMRYGARTSDQDRDALWAHAAAAGVDPSAVVADRFLRRMVVTHGLPIAAAGGLDGRPSVEVQNRPGLHLAGDWVGGEGLLADASLASGQQAGRRAVERVRSCGGSLAQCSGGS